MKNVPITALFSILFCLSVNAYAENVYQSFALPSPFVTPNQLWRYTGSGVVKDVQGKAGIIVIETNLGTEESPDFKTITYTVRDSDMLDTGLVNTTITFSYYHEDQYDVITNIK